MKSKKVTKEAVKTTSTVSRSKTTNIPKSRNSPQPPQFALTLPQRNMPWLRSQSQSSPTSDQANEPTDAANTAIILRPHQSYPPQQPSLLTLLQPASQIYETTTNFSLPSDEEIEDTSSRSSPATSSTQNTSDPRPQIIIVENNYQQHLREQAAAAAKRRSAQDTTTTTPNPQTQATAETTPASTPPPSSNLPSPIPPPSPLPTDTHPQAPFEFTHLSTLASLIARVKKLRRKTRRSLEKVQESLDKATMENEVGMMVVRSGLEAQLRRERGKGKRRGRGA